MIQERNFPTFLKKLTPAPKLWLALGLILSVLLLKNMYFSIAVALVSIIMVFHEKQITLFKVLLVTMTILFVSMYGIHGAMAPVIDKANDPVLFNVHQLLRQGLCIRLALFPQGVPADVRAVHNFPLYGYHRPRRHHVQSGYSIQGDVHLY